jgi:RimJ/RimL family protein N-acetyltransferase
MNETRRAHRAKTLDERYKEALEGPFGRGPMCPVFTTARLRLRMPRPEDLDFLTKLDADPDVMRYIHEGALSRRDAREFGDIAIEMAPRRAHLHKWLVETTSEGLRISGCDRPVMFDAWHNQIAGIVSKSGEMSWQHRWYRWIEMGSP